MKREIERPVVIPGGSGFLGRLLVRHLEARGVPVVVLSRAPQAVQGAPARERVLWWDGETQGDWCAALEGARAVVNLAGRSVDCRYHRRNREAILRSRVDSTRVLGEAIGACAAPPPVWLNASTATIYRHAQEREMDEASGELGTGFSVEVALAWEAELEAALASRTRMGARTARTRKVALRTAMVLSAQPGGVLDVLARLARLGLGGTLGPGNQLVSWIHARDFCRAVEFLIEREDLAGAVNVAAPRPSPNRELMAAVRAAVQRRFGLPATRWMLELGAFALRTETELVLKSRNVVPGRLLEAGFRFELEDARAAVDDLLGKGGGSPDRQRARPARAAGDLDALAPARAGEGRDQELVATAREPQ